ncbi:MAG: hypothetical protein HYV60_08025 [Planctomycetia bacterium]|nr:hypothetical protein [Planctomycetia bacterium]
MFLLLSFADGLGRANQDSVVSAADRRDEVAQADHRALAFREQDATAVATPVQVQAAVQLHW